MDIRAFNEYLAQDIINEGSIGNALKDYNVLKKQNKKKAIITAYNREKFIVLLKKIGPQIVDMDFSYEDFSGVKMDEMQFTNCTFAETNFENAYLDVIDFYSCNLNHAVFHKAFMDCACFDNCSCRHTDFSNAHLMAAYINESDWTEANISGVNLIEVEAHHWEINGMIVNENTAIVEGEFYDVNWSKANVSRLNISLNQVKYFLQSTNGGKYLQVYEDYSPSSLQKKENAILKALWDEYEQHKMDGAEVYQIEDGLVFLSYASEQEKIVREFYEAEKNKHKLWMDIELIKEAELKLQVDRILNSCVMAVIFLSKEYLIKAWTRYEFLRLLEEKEKRNIEIIIVPLTAGVEDVITQYCSMNSSISVKDIGELSDWLSIEQSKK